MGIGGYQRDTMPFLDDLARRSVWFANAFGGGPGSPLSFASMFTSTYPLDYGGYGYVDRPRVLFPEALQEAGYRTIGIHSSPYLSAYFGYNRGWDTFRYLSYFKVTGSAAPMSPGLRRGTMKSKFLKRSAAGGKWLDRNLPFLALIFRVFERGLLTIRKIVKDIISFKPHFFTAEEMNNEVARVLDERDERADRPLFLWLHYLDPHIPYGLFYRRGHGLLNALKYHASDLLLFVFGEFPRLNRMFLPLYKRVYDDSLRYVDENIKNLFSMLSERGILNDDTMIVVHSDHGEGFLEHGTFGHGQYLFNEHIKVPLIIHAPGRLSEPASVERPVSLIDVAPTILSFAGAQVPSTYRGVSLFDGAERDVVAQSSESAGDLSDCRFTGIAIISRGYKLIRWKDEKMLFSLRDGMERENLYDKEIRVVQELEQRVLPYLPGDEYESSVPGWPPKSVS